MIGFIIQARIESTRYPNKIIKPFYNGQSIISLQLEKLVKNFDLPIILATSTNKSNDILEKIASDKMVHCFRGSENDVLKRFIDASEVYKFDHIIRVCSDNPFLDIERLTRLLDFYQNNKNLDYISFLVNKTPSIKTHFGFWVEIVAQSALKNIKNHTSDSFYFEHVTNYIYSKPEIFQIDWLKEDLTIHKDIRLTIDTARDFEICARLYDVFMERSWNLSDLVSYISKRPSLLKQMRAEVIKNSK